VQHPTLRKSNNHQNHQQNKKEIMKTFVTVTQISATKFDVEKVSAETSSRVRTKGLLVSCWESNQQNDKYCFELAEKMTKELN
jgi:hypothetical protein